MICPNTSRCQASAEAQSWRHAIWVTMIISREKCQRLFTIGDPVRVEFDAEGRIATRRRSRTRSRRMLILRDMARKMAPTPSPTYQMQNKAIELLAGRLERGRRQR